MKTQFSREHFQSIRIITHLSSPCFRWQLLTARKWKSYSLSRVQLFATPWAVARQAPLSMGFPRQEYWSGLPSPSPGGPPDPGVKPRFPALQAESLLSQPSKKPHSMNVPTYERYWGRPSQLWAIDFQVTPHQPNTWQYFSRLWQLSYSHTHPLKMPPTRTEGIHISSFLRHMILSSIGIFSEDSGSSLI